ncbi:UDP-N-acetylmuramoylalanyl-D-glutamate--2,6-diaminopimelate ligase [Tessaracoccus bendigoensis DSM 12906]|uniref:UDP-N-acetylmuramoyl-L-alanyl-D-glutamate--2,6-diaminopimelate ligase n=1 Tax=Tessaracoccus bendigoensis DSM 12906 TaxID=1123357 RepID=A0A1M6AQA8_9ACTN|nr:UDP-N-acetylmuramoyl-L-alanyl-D-glutamate--2,6-diaminopimelate ligase [Tessaracoccus bendigoensis]SHI38709.1 UDP-N-acetylmuramoylalanyl-D-glutamate--2,6-diaminopimelate ligase [Tessaracoccus bendigoensis DSM 12906]
MESPLRPSSLPPATLGSLVAGLGLVGDTDSRVAVSGITLDSRSVEPGWLYVALPGSRAHGAAFSEAAVEAGAAAILTDDAGRELIGASLVPVVAALDVRSAMATVSARLFGEPGRQMTMLGVTGTNGKTTTVALLQSGLMAADVHTGTIGTIGFRLDAEELRSSRTTVTTPESPDLQSLLAVMQRRGAGAVALEVSSHALALGRVDAIGFDVVGFLNLGRDHLDFHKSMEDYFEAKARLFEPGRSAVSVIWVDDQHGAELAGRVLAHGRSRLVTVGTAPGVDYRPSGYRADGAFGGRAVVARGGESLELRIGMPGEYNMVDAVVALAMLEAVGVPTDAALRGLAVAQVPGRMQRVHLGDDAPTVVVDFAHTPQAVEAAVGSLSDVGPVISVLGCGGDRDPEKREGMGAAAARGSRVTIITDDNPRTEDPAAIRAQTLAGARGVGGAEVVEVAGRRAAIEEALRRATSDSVVAILGKGHERGQILADRTVDFDDVEEATLAWRRLREEGDKNARS